MTIQEMLQQALNHHQAGQLAEAEAFYRRVLDMQPKHPDALHLLGVLHSQTGRQESAMEMMRRAINLNPSAAHYHDNLGVALDATGQIDLAINAHRRAIALKADFTQAHNHLGHALLEKGQLQAAIASFREAIRLYPDYAEALNNLGNALTLAGDFAGAITACRAAVGLAPEYAEAHNNLGNALCQAGELEAAVAAHRRAAELRPGDPEAHTNLAIALREQGRFAETLVACTQALAIKPDHTEALNNMGIALFHTGELDRAVSAYDRVLELRPDHFHARANLGSAYFAKGEFERAKECYRETIVQRPDHASAHWNLGLLLLTQGDFERGWPEYEWRWRIKEFALHGALTQPLWDGSELAGRRILLYAEQGFGDAIQFIRYIPLVAARGGRITLVCPPELRRLLGCFAAIEQWSAPDQPVPQHDIYCPLLTLARIFKSIPANVPYITVEPDLLDHWKGRLGADGRRKVGLAWAGRPTHFNDRNRSFALNMLAGLAGIPNTRYISLQKGEAAQQARHAPMEVTDWTDELNDFADTAALIGQLDVVISADTAVAHLAGALGKRVYLLLPFVPDWRWMLNRNDSPWYPTMRLFRQPAIGDWMRPVGRVVEELSKEK